MMCIFAEIPFRSLLTSFQILRDRLYFHKLHFGGPLTFISLLKPKSTFEVVLYIVLSVCNFSPLSYPHVQGRYTHIPHTITLVP